jgi:hypothetical protein
MYSAKRKHFAPTCLSLASCPPSDAPDVSKWLSGRPSRVKTDWTCTASVFAKPSPFSTPPTVAFGLPSQQPKTLHTMTLLLLLIVYISWQGKILCIIVMRCVSMSTPANKALSLLLIVHISQQGKILYIIVMRCVSNVYATQQGKTVSSITLVRCSTSTQPAKGGFLPPT